MLKKAMMLTFIGSAFLFGSACFLHGAKDETAASSTAACKGLAGKALADCEAHNGG